MFVNIISEVMENLISLNLKRARLNRGWSMEELAEQIGCSKQTISNYENGKRNPDSQTLQKIGNILDLDFEYFFTRPDISFSLNSINYREGAYLSIEEKRLVEERSQVALSSYLELEVLTKEVTAFINPLEDLVIKNRQDAERAAKHLRKKWKLGDGPISNISNFLEKKGVRVIRLDFGFNFNHEGLSGWAENQAIPVIVLNMRSQDITRVRFTMLHELGHLLLEIPTDIEMQQVERICDSFASAVLLPAEILIEEFGRNRKAISLAELRRIKALYGISISAIMVRARFADLIDVDAYQKWKESDYWGQDFGQFVGIEEPQKFNQMLFRALAERKIGLDKAASLSNRDENELKAMLYQTVDF